MKLNQGTKWPRRKLSELCQINPARDRDLTATDDTEVAFVPMPSVCDETGTIARPLARSFGAVKKGYTYFRSGDVLFAKISPCMQNGKHAVVGRLPSGFGFGSTEFHVMRPNQEVIAEWLHRYLRQPSLLESLDQEMTGAVGQQRLPEDVLGRVELPLPPLARQREIVARLDAQLAAAARARTAVAAQLAEAERLEPALIEEVLTKVADSKVPLGELLASPLRTGLSKPTLPDSPYRCLTLAAVRDGLLNLDASKPVEMTTEEAKRHTVRADAFYVVRGNGNRSLVGRGALPPAEASSYPAFPDLLFEVRPDQARLDRNFLRWVWDSRFVREQIESAAATAAGIYKINQKNLAAIALPLPPLSTQATIAGELSRRCGHVSALRTRLAARLAELDRLPAALLRTAFADP